MKEILSRAGGYDGIGRKKQRMQEERAEEEGEEEEPVHQTVVGYSRCRLRCVVGGH